MSDPIFQSLTNPILPPPTTTPQKSLEKCYVPKLLVHHLLAVFYSSLTEVVRELEVMEAWKGSRKQRKNMPPSRVSTQPPFGVDVQRMSNDASKGLPKCKRTVMHYAYCYFTKMYNTCDCQIVSIYLREKYYFVNNTEICPIQNYTTKVINTS